MSATELLTSDSNSPGADEAAPSPVADHAPQQRRPSTSPRLGEQLIGAKLISAQQLDDALHAKGLRHGSRHLLELQHVHFRKRQQQHEESCDRSAEPAPPAETSR